jgi:SHS2 domain-containing protein
LIYAARVEGVMRYKVLEHTADAMVEILGKDLNEMFENAAYAMFDQITDVTKVESKGEIRIVLDAESREQLLVDFLQELLFVQDLQDFVFSKFEIKTDGKHLEALCGGEKFDAGRHAKRSVVKGVTYHKLEFDDKNGKLTLLFDV